MTTKEKMYYVGKAIAGLDAITIVGALSKCRYTKKTIEDMVAALACEDVLWVKYEKDKAIVVYCEADTD